jgi:hypothetical protein
MSTMNTTAPAMPPMIGARRMRLSDESTGVDGEALVVDEAFVGREVLTMGGAIVAPIVIALV